MIDSKIFNILIADCQLKCKDNPPKDDVRVGDGERKSLSIKVKPSHELHINPRERKKTMSVKPVQAKAFFLVTW